MTLPTHQSSQAPHVTTLSEHLSASYDVPRELVTSEISIGLIHATHQVESKDGARWVAQGLHPKLSDPSILEDYEAVTAHLHSQGYQGPRLVKTLGGERVSEYQGRLWRVSTYVPGETYTQVDTADLAYRGGMGIAHFHRAMQTLEHSFRSTHPGHDTRGHLRRLREASQRDEHQARWSEIRGWGEEIIAQLSETLLPESLPKSIVHGDPKISNLRFQDQRAVMIDLDTCNLHTRLVDLGDAIRSWCHQPDAPLGSRFSLERCQALIEGYLSGADPLTELEATWLPHAGRVITLELASRFTLDDLEDHYFAYDATRFASRRAHNEHRAQLMCQLAREMKSATPQLSAWLKGLTSR